MTTDQATVRTGGRLHFGFRNLSSARDRLYGSIGVAVTTPTVTVTATPAPGIDCTHDRARDFATTAVSLLGVDGATVTVEEELPRHVGLGSGTQLALATYRAIAAAHGVPSRVRTAAPALGRGRRSGIGIATFERGGFVVDNGHPAEDVLKGPREPGAWEAPDVAHRFGVPASWRFVLVLPDAPPGKASEAEAKSMRAAIDSADSETADEIEAILTDQLLPAITDRAIEVFGEGITRIDALNGSWFEQEQSATHRPAAREIVDSLQDHEAIYGVGQSSWGALVYGLTTANRREAASEAGRVALESSGRDGNVWIVSGRNHGATVNDFDTGKGTMTTHQHGATKE